MLISKRSKLTAWTVLATQTILLGLPAAFADTAPGELASALTSPSIQSESQQQNAGAASSGDTHQGAGAYVMTTNQGMDLPGFEWSLPCEGKLEPLSIATKSSGKKMLQGTVTTYDVDGDFGNLIDNMLDGAIAKSNRMGYLDKSVAHYRKASTEKIQNAKEASNLILPHKGFAPSSEAADVILDEKIKIKDKASAEYARQRYIDELHPQVVAKTMQLAMAMGIRDTARREQAVDKAMESLTNLVGKNKADMAMQQMQRWSKEVKVPTAVYGTVETWDVDFFQTKLKEVTKVAMDGDPVMKEVIDRLQKYNHMSTAKRASGKLVEGGLNLASWAAPGLVIPLAIEVVNAAYIMATGGPEESKLVKELYYDKRVESRYRTINEEAQLALTQYQNALNARNPVLLVTSESVLSQLVGPESIQEVLGGRTLLTHHIGARAVETAQSSSQTLQ